MGELLMLSCIWPHGRNIHDDDDDDYDDDADGDDDDYLRDVCPRPYLNVTRACIHIPTPDQTISSLICFKIDF